MKFGRRFWIFGAVGVAVFGVAVALFAQPPQERRSSNSVRGTGNAVPVLASAATVADVPVYLDGVGSVRALNTVTVKAQVDGKILRMTFKEGQDVQKGDVLVQLDPVIYQAQLDQAIAKKAQDQSLLDNAKQDLERYQRLVKTAAIAVQQVDAQKALVVQRDAQLQADDAAIENARAYLAYTTITAPVSGRIGIRLVDEGNLVRAADTTGIVVITQIRPITVIFTLPQQQLAQVMKAAAKAPLNVDVMGADNRTVIDHGTMQVIDNQIDQVTGTVKIKAEFPNAELQLWPGQFINVRMLVDTLQQATVVPTSAIQRGPNGAFVFVVRDDSTVTVRNVTIAQQNDVRAVIAKGVQSGERVVTSGFARLADNSRVTVSTAAANDPNTADPNAAADPAKPRTPRTAPPNRDPSANPDARPQRNNAP